MASSDKGRTTNTNTDVSSEQVPPTEKNLTELGDEHANPDLNCESERDQRQDLSSSLVGEEDTTAEDGQIEVISTSSAPLSFFPSSGQTLRPANPSLSLIREEQVFQIHDRSRMSAWLLHSSTRLYVNNQPRMMSMFGDSATGDSYFLRTGSTQSRGFSDFTLPGVQTAPSSVSWGGCPDRDRAETRAQSPRLPESPQFPTPQQTSNPKAFDTFAKSSTQEPQCWQQVSQAGFHQQPNYYHHSQQLPGYWLSAQSPGYAHPPQLLPDTAYGVGYPQPGCMYLDQHQPFQQTPAGLGQVNDAQGQQARRQPGRDPGPTGMQSKTGCDVSSRTVEVQGPRHVLQDEELLKLYFTNEDESGGGSVEQITYDRDNNLTQVVFVNVMVAKAVVGRSHTLRNELLQVSPVVPMKPRIPVAKANPDGGHLIGKKPAHTSPARPMKTLTSGGKANQDRSQPYGKEPSHVSQTAPSKPQTPMAKANQDGGHPIGNKPPNVGRIVQTKPPTSVGKAKLDRSHPYRSKPPQASLSVPMKPQTSEAKAVPDKSPHLRNEPSEASSTIKTGPQNKPFHGAAANLFNTISVRGINLRGMHHQICFDYFENTKRAGGKEVTCLVRDFQNNVVYVSFPTEEEAKQVAERDHTLNQQRLDIGLVEQPTLVRNRLAIRNLPGDITFDDNDLQDFLEGITRHRVHSIDDSKLDEGILVVRFRKDIDPAQVQQLLKNEEFMGHSMFGDPLLPSGKVLVSELPRNHPISCDVLKEYFENSAHARVTHVEFGMPVGNALITFEDAKVAAAVADRKHKIRGCRVNTSLFFDCLGIDFQLDQPEPLSEHDLQSQKDESRMKDMKQVGEDFEQPEPTAGGKLKVVGETSEQKPVERRRKSVNLQASPGKQSFCKTNNLGEDILAEKPDLNICYNTKDECIQIEGEEKDVDEMRLLMEGYLNALCTASHTWSPHLPVEFRTTPEIEEAITSACLQVCHDNGAVAFTPDGFEVAAFDPEEAVLMMSAGAARLKTKELQLPEEETMAVSNRREWKNLKSSLQDRNKNRLVLREEQSRLTVTGVTRDVDEATSAVKSFFEKIVNDEQTFPMNRDLEEMFWVFFFEEQRGLSSKDIYFLPDQNLIFVKGKRDQIKSAEEVVEEFKKRLVERFEVINEPSIDRFLATNDWKIHCNDIERRLKCKIQELKDGDSTIASAQSTPVTEPDNILWATGGNSAGDVLGATGGNPAGDVLGATGGNRAVKPGDVRQSLNQSGFAALTQIGGRKQPLNVLPKIHLYTKADLTKEDVRLMVNSASADLDLTLGLVSKALLLAGGPSIQADCNKKYPNGIRLGEIAVTTGGSLKCVNLAHCCLPSTTDQRKMKKAVETATTKCLQIAEEKGFDSVAFPALGAGTLRYPPDLVAKAMYNATIRYGQQNPHTRVYDVTFILLEQDVHNHWPFQAEDRLYRQKLEEIRKAADIDPIQQSLINPNAVGVHSYKNFEDTRRSVRLHFLGLSQASVDSACQELMQCYQQAVKSVRCYAPDLDQWDDLQLSTLITACAPVHVDLTLNFSLNVIDLHGFLKDLDRIDIHGITRKAEDELHERRNAARIARQVQWYRIDVGEIEEFLTPYDVIKNYQIEMAYRNGEVQKHFGATIVDFIKWQEVSERQDDPNHPPVDLKRHHMIQELALLPPDTWGDMGNNLFDLVRLRDDSAEYLRIERIFKQSVNFPTAKVVKIERVQNQTLYKQYMAMKRHMMTDKPCCEKENLWHGTKEANVDRIVRLGFDRGYSLPARQKKGQKANAHGQGVYFATKAEYSCQNQYAVMNEAGERRVFLCRVLVGNSILGTPTMRGPVDASGKTYDSAVDDLNNPTMFVIFKDVQAYPDYLIVCTDF